MFSDKEMQILAYLRKNARTTLTKIAKKTGIPISTIFDKIREHEKTVIKKHTTLLNFEELGYGTWVKILLSSDKKDKDELKKYLQNNFNVNSVFQINNGFDFLVEGIFRSIKEMEKFLERLDERFDITEKRYYFVIDELKREEFLSDPNLGAPNP